MDIHTRLREERERLGLLQKDVASLVGMTPRAQLMYESGERHPDSLYLATIAEAGFDILYILTGDRTAQAAPVALPSMVQASGGQAFLPLSVWATLLNLRYEHGDGRPLMWCEALFAALDGYTPAQPLQLAAQVYTAATKYGRSRQGLALYLVTNHPSAPWLVWPDGRSLKEVYALDMGEDTLPLFVPDTHRLPGPALLLSPLELNHLIMGQTLLVDWHGAGGVLNDGNSGPDYADKTARAIKRSFVGK
jgi:transcriptional regulator with XRE-family HTH domain